MIKFLPFSLISVLLVTTYAQATIDDEKIQTVKSLYKEARAGALYDHNGSEFDALYSYAGSELKQKINLFEISDKNYSDGSLNDCGYEGYNVLRLTLGDSYGLEEVSDFEFRNLRNGDVRAIMYINGENVAPDSYVDALGESTEYRDFDVECIGDECKIIDIHENGRSVTNGLELVCF